MKHYLLNHQPQKGLQAACAQQGQAPTCNARGKGHTSASPKTLTRILLVLLTMFLLPSAAWGEGEYISSTFSGINLGQGVGPGPISYNSATATTSTTDASTPRITQESTATGWDVKNLSANYSICTGADNATSSETNFVLRPIDRGQANTITFTLESQFGINGKFVKAEIIYNYSYIKSITANATKNAGSSTISIANSNIPFTCSESGTAEATTGEITANASDYSNMVFANNKIDLSFTVTTAAVQSGIPSFTISEIRLYFENVTEQPFNIWVNGTSLTGQNITTFLDGKLGYTQPDENKPAILHLKGTTAIQSIYTTLKDLEIHLSGKNQIIPSSQLTNGICSSQSSDEGTLTFTTEEGGSLTIETGVSVIRGFGKCTGNLETHEPYNITNYLTSGAYYYLSTNSEGTDTTTIKWLKITEAQTYPLWIAGTQVTESNKGNVLGDSKVSFTPAEGNTLATLTLNNANITVSGKNAIESGLENLTVNLVGGDNVITCQGSTDRVFKGPVSGAKVTFTTDATTPGVLSGSVLNDSYIFDGITPEYQNGLNYLRDGDSFSIKFSYGLKIGDTDITPYIGSDGTITGISAISSGTVKFTPADNTTAPATPATLTLDNATLTAGIVTGMNMTIDLKGNNSITVNGGYALSVPNNESPTITFTSSSSPIGNLTLKSTASEVYGLVEGNIYILYDTSKGIVPSFLVTTADDPTTANFTNSTEAVITNGTAYGLYIADVPVTNSNASGITGSGIKGTVTYADATKTLTLNGAEITGNISSSISQLKVYLIGENSITPANGSTPFAYTGAVGTTSPQLSFESSDTDEGELTLSGDITTSGSGQNITLSSGGYSYSNTFGTGESVTTFGDWIIDYPDSKKRIYYNPHYGITVGNYEVTKKNKNMVTNLSDSDIKYLPEDQALLIPSNSTFADCTIKSHREVLTIYVSGDCVSKSIIFESNSNFPATSGVLIIKKDPSSTASINKLTLNNTDGVITGFSNVTIDESLNLLTPATTPTWDATVTEAVFTDETLYDLWVEGIRVTSGNKDNVKGEYSTNVNDPITPSVVFDGNNKLTLTNASITVTDKNAIESGIENLTVNLVGGENIITCQGTNDVAFKAVGSGNKITFATTSSDAVQLSIRGGHNPIIGLDTDYENGLGFLYSSTDQQYSVETLETPEIKKTAETEDGITVALVLPSGDKYSSNTTMYYKITYSDETVDFAEYSSAFTMAKPGTVTAYLVPLGGKSNNAVAKYYGYPAAPYTIAVGDEITPEIYPAIDVNDYIELMNSSSGDENIASFTYSDGIVKATGIGNTTLTATFTAGDQPFTVLNPIADPQAPHEFTATFSVIVGGSLSDYFEGSNEFGSFYNTSETTYAVPEGMKAYVITGVNGDKVITTETTVLPPNTVVLMDKGEGKAFTYIPATSGSAPTGNLLKRATSDVAVNTSSKLFVLYNDEYVKATAGSPIPAGKNYLDLSGVTAAGTRGFYNIGDGEDGTTAIREVRSGEAGSEKTADGGWHDLQGRRLSAKPTKPGLYILNGKKVAIK